eukprot:TRINITY_DN18030_c1_g1_i1.p1 TRINITY_DN18030_c1_g1~~TRINITY_DN18030_c1_g1_i1.p1  ORF type:complete len:446 (+),score=106.12 TRINITY_DN18030_c1_g1_i1:388-1725(+)
MAKLFVGQVPAICSEDQLSAIFGQFGEILDISIMRDKTTGRSKGSAWVVFEDASAAEDAIATLHDKHSIPPQSNSLQIRYAGASKPGPASPKQTSPPTHSVMTPPNMNIASEGAPPPSRFVPHQPATGTPLGGINAWDPQQHQIDPPMHGGTGSPQWSPSTAPPMQSNNINQMGEDDDGSPRKKDKKYPPCGGRKLFVGQLPKDMTREDVRNLMADYGNISELHVMTDKRTGQGTGAAFVIFENRQQAQRAIQELNGVITVAGMKCPMQVRFAEGELDKTQDGKLFVGQVPYAANEEDLKRLFSPFGDLTEVALVRKGGQSKGCGFVRFGDRQYAERAIDALNGTHTMVGGHSPLTVRFADSEEEKRKRREDRHVYQLQSMISQMQTMPGTNLPQNTGHPQQQQQQHTIVPNNPIIGGGMPFQMGQMGLQGIMGGLPLYSPVISQ